MTDAPNSPRLPDVSVPRNLPEVDPHRNHGDAPPSEHTPNATDTDEQGEGQMRGMLRVGASLASIVALGACGTDSSAGSAETIRVETRLPVLVTDEPLGDVVEGELGAGDAATALCFVPGAGTNTGAVGSAIRIESGRLSGYAAVTTLPVEAADRAPVFDVSEDDLREGLPPCRLTSR